MARVTIDNELFQIIGHFSKGTGVTPKDTMIGKDGSLIFIVDKADAGKAIGPSGRNVRVMEETTGKKVRIIVHSEDLEEFIMNAIKPLQVTGMERDSAAGIILLHAADSRTRSLLIGRAAQHLRTFEQVIQRYFPEVKELRVS